MLDATEAKKPHELIDELFIETPSAQEALGAIEILRKHGTRRDCCECVLLAGPSRVGKSAVVDHYKQLHQLIKMIPKNASVAATEYEAPHVSNREDCFTLRFFYENADYLLINPLHAAERTPKFVKLYNTCLPRCRSRADALCLHGADRWLLLATS